MIATAGSVAFFTLLAIFPAIAVVVSLYGIVADARTIGDHLALLVGILPEGIIALIRDQIALIVSKPTKALSIAFAIGLGTALWSANSGMGALFDSLNVVYGEREKRSLIRFYATTFLFTIGAILFVVLAITAVVVLPIALGLIGVAYSAEAILSVARWPLLLVIVMLGLAAVYRFGPSRSSARWRWVSLGSAAASLMWIATSMGFSWYVASFDSYNRVYGSLGAGIGFMVWIWISVIIVLIGAELNAEMEHQTARDTTTGPDLPLGTRGATVADHVGAARDLKQPWAAGHPGAVMLDTSARVISPARHGAESEMTASGTARLDSARSPHRNSGLIATQGRSSHASHARCIARRLHDRNGPSPCRTRLRTRSVSHMIRWPENVDPYFNNLRAGVIISQQVWDTLIYRNPVTGEYKGQLATSWKQIDDKTLEFELRQGVKFHDGSTFTADDVVYTFNFVSKPENRATTQANVNWIDHAEKIDTYRVRLITKQPFPAAIDYLSGPLVIFPHEYYAKVGPKGMNEKPIGSGPFRVTSHVIGKSITLERFAEYSPDLPKGVAKLAKVAIRFIPDRQTQMAEILAGGLDFIMNVPKDQAEQVGGVPGYQAVSGETMRIAFLHFDILPDGPGGPLKDLRVRQAINHAINKDAMVKELVGGGSRVLVTPCFPSQFGCTDEGATRYPYDVAKAKALLKEAGFPNGFAIDIYGYRERQQLEAIINDLGAVGIKANLRYLQYAAMRDAMRGNTVPMALQTWGSNSVNDVSASTPVYFGGGADDVSRDKEVQAALHVGRHFRRPGRRKAAYRKALDLITQHAYNGAALHGAEQLRRFGRPRVQGLSGRDAALLGDELEVIRRPQW